MRRQGLKERVVWCPAPVTWHHLCQSLPSLEALSCLPSWGWGLLRPLEGLCISPQSLGLAERFALPWVRTSPGAGDGDQAELHQMAFGWAPKADLTLTRAFVCIITACEHLLCARLDAESCGGGASASQA